MSGSKSYNYSTSHRQLEIFSILALGLLLGVICYEVSIGAIYGAWSHLWWLVPLSALAGYLAADFVSGVVHWLADNYGGKETPVLGPAFVRPFREHHDDPLDITRHDFIETNGNNSIVCVPAALLAYWLLPAREEWWGLFGLSFVLWFMIAIFMTNQFHKWAHLEERPSWIAFLQSCRLILGHGHHEVHHTRPHDRYYCITNGCLNPVLRWLRFFEILEGSLRLILGVTPDHMKRSRVFQDRLAEEHPVNSPGSSV